VCELLLLKLFLKGSQRFVGSFVVSTPSWIVPFSDQAELGVEEMVESWGRPARRWARARN
jgi:hypothetical protein